MVSSFNSRSGRLNRRIGETVMIPRSFDPSEPKGCCFVPLPSSTPPPPGRPVWHPDPSKSSHSVLQACSPSQSARSPTPRPTRKLRRGLGHHCGAWFPCAACPCAVPLTAYNLRFPGTPQKCDGWGVNHEGHATCILWWWCSHEGVPSPFSERKLPN